MYKLKNEKTINNLLDNIIKSKNYMLTGFYISQLKKLTEDKKIIQECLIEFA